MHLDELRHLDNRLSKTESALLKKHVDTVASWFKQKVCYYLASRHDKSGRGNHQCYLITVEEGNHVIDQSSNAAKKGKKRNKQAIAAAIRDASNGGIHIEGSEKLSSYLGIVGRDMVPIIYDDWRLVPLERKYLIWEAIKQRFTLDEESRSYCMGTVGRLQRSRKVRLRRIIDSYKSNAMIMNKRPKEIDLKEWNFFVKGKSSPVFKAKSKKFKNMRSKQVFPYTGSRRGYARLENDMAINVLRDTISKLYDKKKSAKPSSIVRVDVWAKAHTKANSEPSNEEAAKNLVKIEELKKSLPLNSTSPPLKDDMLSQAQSVSEVRSAADDEVLRTQMSTPQWVPDDPECMLHNNILGPNVCKVAVMNAVIPLFPLWRVIDDANTIGGALKSFIAWLNKYVVMMDD
ncbi:hypothetical protein GIB67_039789 [Kingdonia uniflora]|uniref:Uncharacterized protein n=1 Tax=Kingdonia uniflora TaxID=39325 RepID=A0A7J7P3U6_9MAGN|nr:hypothetical protein GIB67_039789 [Kingdonia uniflora]